MSNDEAANALSDATYRGSRPASVSVGASGSPSRLYSCLYGMRTGLLSRFWGSLGMALGVAALLLLVQFTLIWFIYFGLLLIGIGGRHPPGGGRGSDPTPEEKLASEIESAGFRRH